ncbi:hypothetical protein SAMN05660199_03197 [Klenkia soli]|uniref:Nucleotidyl transferase AbiEii toxin, Type IV TA system n=1 Tax=Klenkia soli TaxID=1052260 RepID=A0A1H0Q378_9ACTN|nr:hypothetical protein [Klenkia soli]SDP11852.1 hypothetical protein SAMN05660199_03197 [Klenkia soli]
MAELSQELHPDTWMLIGGLMVQIHAAAAGLPIVRATEDIDVLLHVEGGRGRAAEVAGGLERLGYQLRPGFDPRTAAAHRFVREGAVVDLVTSDPEPDTQDSVVDVVVADHVPPRVLERLKGYDMVPVDGGTQARRRATTAQVDITDEPTVVTVPNAFGALILKAAAHKADSRDPGRHLLDAAVLLACVDPFEDRIPSGSDRGRLLHLQEHLGRPTAPAWLQLPEGARRSGLAALGLLLEEPRSASR